MKFIAVHDKLWACNSEQHFEKLSRKDGATIAKATRKGTILANIKNTTITCAYSSARDGGGTLDVTGYVGRHCEG